MNRLGLELAGAWSALMAGADVVERVRGVKLLPNLALPDELWLAAPLPEEISAAADAAVLEAGEASAVDPVLPDAAPSRRRPVNSCLLDLRVVDT